MLLTQRRLRSFLLSTAVLASLSVAGALQHGDAPMRDFRLMTLDPGHFHAALIQKEMYPDVDARVHVFAPLGPDLIGHLNRVAAFNRRPDHPTGWQLEIHTGPDHVERMLRERPGNVVVISGRNHGKITRIAESVEAGLHVLADKPWVLRPDDLPALEQTLAKAETKGIIAYDIMTERFEITTILQRSLVNDREVTGNVLPGSEADPAVYMESVHHLMKTVAGAPNIRPAWFFDTEQQGEGLADVGTHLVDLVQWTLFPEQALDHRRDLRVLSAHRWPTMIGEADFRRVTGAPEFPASLRGQVKNGNLEYFCNTFVSYTARGIHTALNVIWDWEAPAGGGDTHFAFYKGSRSRIEVRQVNEKSGHPELYIVPNRAADKPVVLGAAARWLETLRHNYPGVALDDRGAEIHVSIPDRFRLGHEAHFGEVARRFFGYARTPGSLPQWERANMLAKYFVTTTGTELSRKTVRIAPRIAR